MPLERKGTHLTPWELTRKSVDDPNAEAWWSLGRRWVLRRALWWASLATLWKPLLIMAECQDPGFAWINIEADS